MCWYSAYLQLCFWEAAHPLDQTLSSDSQCWEEKRSLVGGELTVSKVKKCDFLDVYAVNSIVALYTELISIFLLEINGL